MLDYLARGMTGYMIPSGTSPADEKDQPLPADEIMIEFTDRVRRIKSLCELVSAPCCHGMPAPARPGPGRASEW